MANEKTWPRQTRSLWGGLRVLLILTLLLQLLLCLPSAYELTRGPLTADSMQEDLTGIAVALGSGLGGVLWLIIFILTVIYTCRITFRMMKNLDVMEAPGERMSPTMAVVWYFIPFANLIMPFRGVRQIWKGTFELSSEPGPDDGVVTIWWVLWVLSNIAATWSFRMSMEAGGMSEYGPTDVELYNMSLYVGIASNLLGAAASWFMIQTLGPPARAQDEIIRARVPT
jgi:hypothetical protein